MKLPKIGRLATFGKKPVMRETAKAGSYSFLSCNSDDLIGSRRYRIYDEMQNDPQIAACLSIKKSSLLSNGWDIHAASSSKADIEVANFVRFALNEMHGSVLDVLHNVLDALAKGFSIAEINYALIESGEYKGYIGFDTIKSKDPSKYAFVTDDYLNIRGIESYEHSQRLPADKFVIYTYMPRYESPYGTSDLKAAYKPYRYKSILISFMNMYFEKYGAPTAKGTYKRGMPAQAQDELLKVLDKIHRESAFVVPEDIKVELLEATRGGEAGFLSAIKFYDKQISKAILYQTLITDEGANAGSYALAKVHLEVLSKSLTKLKRDLEESVMQEQIIKRLVDYNFNVDNYPTFTLKPMESEDIAVLSSTICSLISSGVVNADEEWIRKYLQLPIN